jgi:hypothetical protein
MTAILFLLGFAVVIAVGCGQSAFASLITAPELDMGTLTAMVSLIGGSYAMYCARKKTKAK